MAESLSVREAATELGVTPGRVRQMITIGALENTAPAGSAPVLAAGAVRELARRRAEAQPAGHAPAADTVDPADDEDAPAVAAPPVLVAAADGSLPTADGARRPRPLVRRRVLFDAKALEGIFERVVSRLPNAVSAGVEPLRAELAAARAALEEQSRLRMQAEARAASAERELEFLRAQLEEVVARPAGLFRRRPRPVVVPQASGTLSQA